MIVLVTRSLLFVLVTCPLKRCLSFLLQVILGLGIPRAVHGIRVSRPLIDVTVRSRLVIIAGTVNDNEKELFV